MIAMSKIFVTLALILYAFSEYIKIYVPFMAVLYHFYVNFYVNLFAVAAEKEVPYTKSISC
jgi:hypothetical protein